MINISQGTKSNNILRILGDLASFLAILCCIPTKSNISHPSFLFDECKFSLKCMCYLYVGLQSTRYRMTLKPVWATHKKSILCQKLILTSNAQWGTPRMWPMAKISLHVRKVILLVGCNWISLCIYFICNIVFIFTIL